MINKYGLLFLVVAIAIACTQDKTSSGEQLARTYCASCHQYTPPSLLDKATWQHSVLPNMGLRLGITHDTVNPYEAMNYEDRIITMEANIYPTQPILKQEEWAAIVTFYLKNAPEKLDLPNYSASPTTLFEATTINVSDITYPMTSFLKYENQKIHLADARKGYFEINLDGTIAKNIPFKSPISDIHFYKNKPTEYLLMGYMHPKDQSLGKVVTIQNDKLTIVADDLIRPVDMITGDLDNDGLEDKVICSFGNHTGKLSWWKQLPDGTYEEYLIHESPGAIKAYLRGWNNDGNFDIVVLTTQGDERIDVYLNQGNGQFERENLIQFPPVYGSSYFELVDFDKDGDEDILYTNGDNADYSIVLKPYHGIRLFKNEDGLFEEAFFLPMHGATKAVARDFDLDGDLDIAAIAHFPNFEQEAGFYFFKNNSHEANGKFERYAIKEASQGRWLTLDTDDIDGDGDQDLLLGSFIFSATAVSDTIKQKWQENPISGLILENRRN